MGDNWFSLSITHALSLFKWPTLDKTQSTSTLPHSTFTPLPLEQHAWAKWLVAHAINFQYASQNYDYFLLLEWPLVSNEKNCWHFSPQTSSNNLNEENCHLSNHIDAWLRSIVAWSNHADTWATILGVCNGCNY